MNKKNKPTCVYTIKKNGEIYRYMVRIVIKGRSHYLGCFKTEPEATHAYETYMEKLSASKNEVA